VPPENGGGQRSMAAAVAQFLAKMYLHEIERHDLLKFGGYLRDVKKQSLRSVCKKFETVMTFLKADGVRGLPTKKHWARYTEEELPNAWKSRRSFVEPGFVCVSCRNRGDYNHCILGFI